MNSDKITIDEVPDEIVEKLINRGLVRRECKECGVEDVYRFKDGHNLRMDCRHCGSEDEIFT